MRPSRKEQFLVNLFLEIPGAIYNKFLLSVNMGYSKLVILQRPERDRFHDARNRELGELMIIEVDTGTVFRDAGPNST